MSRHDFRGYVVGSNREGKEWIVRIKDQDPQWDGKKFSVGSVHFGTNLRPGLDVSFRLNAADDQAHDVTVLPPAEVKQRQKYDPAKRSTQASLNLVVIRGSDDKYSVTPTQAISHKEAREEYRRAGVEDEEVIDFICIDVPEECDNALTALSALVWMNISDDEGFGRVFEEVLTQVYEAGHKQL